MKRVWGSLGVGVVGSLIASALILLFTGPSIGLYGWTCVAVVFLVAASLGFRWGGNGATDGTLHILSDIRSQKQVSIKGIDIKAASADATSILSRIQGRESVTIADSNIKAGGSLRNEKSRRTD